MQRIRETEIGAIRKTKIIITEPKSKCSMSYIMSIQPNASLTNIGLAAPTATAVGILLCVIYYRRMNKKGLGQMELK